ncbi:MAG: hypothetical protein HXY50_02140 [Ignavibacteriaceae bacterium]|nr:hypothetical protein [Ignavibacteriaceae bacterium]
MNSAIRKNNAKPYYLLFMFVGGVFLAASCSTIDYFSSEKLSHGSKITSNNEISLITYNIKAIYEKEEDQIDRLMSHVNEKNYDFVIFQELFDESTRDVIIERADPNHFSTFIARVDYNSFPEFIFQDAGLFMMSSYPRIDLSNIEFGDGIKNSNGVIHMILDKEMSKTNDFLANKSVVGALFDIADNAKLFLFTTHVQAIGTLEHKEIQLMQINEFIKSAVMAVLQAGKVKSSSDLAVILAGDFNSNAYDQQRFERMKEILGEPRDLHMEFHGDYREHTFRFGSGNASRRFDYILAYDKLNGIPLRKVKTQSINTIDVKDKEGISISDHLGLKASLKIN